MRQLTVAIAGLGSRGRDTYARYIQQMPKQFKIVAAADIISERGNEAQQTFNIPSENIFRSSAELSKAPKLADIMIIATPDQDHYQAAISALNSGYDLLLEKPMATTPQECADIAATAAKLGRKAVVCHVLRYTELFGTLKSLISDGRIGDPVSIQARENVGYWHQAHSFVRGNWRNSEHSTPMILQKCCHDMDMLLWLMDKKPRAVSSFGSLELFRKENAPVGSTEYCLDSCAEKCQCVFDAEKIYVTGKTGVAAGNVGWPCNVLTPCPTVESVTAALQKGPYGRCVYRCDNNVVDHQVVNIEFEGKRTVSFSMCAFTGDISRQYKVMGTLGELEADTRAKSITLRRFGEPEEVIDFSDPSRHLSGHGGGDEGILIDLYDVITGLTESRSAVENSVASHIVCFAAEHSRLSDGAVVKV
jgi:predicted dehydrogenase